MNVLDLMAPVLYALPRLEAAQRTGSVKDIFDAMNGTVLIWCLGAKILVSITLPTVSILTTIGFHQPSMCPRNLHKVTSGLTMKLIKLTKSRFLQLIWMEL